MYKIYKRYVKIMDPYVTDFKLRYQTKLQVSQVIFKEHTLKSGFEIILLDIDES